MKDENGSAKGRGGQKRSEEPDFLVVAAKAELFGRSMRDLSVEEVRLIELLREESERTGGFGVVQVHLHCGKPVAIRRVGQRVEVK
jgi:hypothetical protein